MNELDLGKGVTLRFVTSPDSDQVVGALFGHRHINTKRHLCEDNYLALNVKGGWKVEQWEPLTLSPSVLCHCGFNGFVREGRWVRA